MVFKQICGGCLDGSVGKVRDHVTSCMTEDQVLRLPRLVLERNSVSHRTRALPRALGEDSGTSSVDKANHHSRYGCV
jgi:hypothetical protein